MNSIKHITYFNLSCHSDPIEWIHIALQGHTHTDNLTKHPLLLLGEGVEESLVEVVGEVNDVYVGRRDDGLVMGYPVKERCLALYCAQSIWGGR